MNRQKFRTKTTVITLLFIFFTSLFATLFVFQINAESNTVATNSQPLSVSINPTGPIQLEINQTQILTANTNLQDIPLTYSWSVENSSGNSPINGTNLLLITYDNQALFKFLTNNFDFCWLSVTAHSTTKADKSTITLQNVASIADNKTSQETTQQTIQPTQTPISLPTPTQNLNSNPNTTPTPTINPLLSANFIVQNDEKNHYQVVNTTDSSIIEKYSSSSPNTTLNNAIANGGIIAIMSGDYSGAQLIVPSNANIVSAPDSKGIKYASIADGARINEPNFNDAFGDYQTGAYTVTTNSTASATFTTWYLAFKPDKQIYYASTNASYTLNSATNNGGGIFIVGNLTLTKPITLSISRTSLYSDGSGILVFDGVDGINITNSGVNVYNLLIKQAGYGRIKTGITCAGKSGPIGYLMLSNVKLWGWNTALLMKNTWSSQINGTDTSFSYTGLHIWGQSVNNVFSSCQFVNYGTNQTTVLIERDDNLDVSPEGNIISNSLIYGGNLAIYLSYTSTTKISDSIIDGWTHNGVIILGRQDNSLSNDWIGCSPGANPDSIAVKVHSNSASVKGCTLLAYNWSIYIDSSSNCLINDNSFIGVALVDIYLSNNDGGSIINNNFSASSQTGILMQNSQGFSIYSNVLMGKGTAINVITSQHNSMVANIINGTLQNGVILDGSKYNGFTGNSIYNSGQQANNIYYDIWLIDGSSYNNICDNTITALGNNRTAWGIMEGSYIDDFNVYSGNILTGQQSGAIGINGANSLRGTNIPAIG